MKQMVLLGDDRWTPSGIGRGCVGEIQRADHAGKELGMASEAKENTENWVLFLSVAIWEQRTARGWCF